MATVKQRKLELAKQAIDRGWALHPLDGKVPVLPGWQKMDFAEIEQVEEWIDEKYNIGIRTGSISGIMVVDFDGDATWDDLGIGEAPPTVIVETGSGGMHYYFKWQHPIGNSAGKLGPGIDVRGEGGQVVAPGSRHPETKKYYRYIPGFAPEFIDPAPLPEKLAERLLGGKPEKGPERPVTSPKPYEGRDTPYATRALTDEILALRACTENRNHQLNRSAFALAGLVKAGELDEERAVDELIEAAAHCGLGDRETRKTIRSAFESAEARNIEHTEPVAVALKIGGQIVRSEGSSWVVDGIEQPPPSDVTEYDLIDAIVNPKPVPPVPWALHDPRDPNKGFLVKGGITIFSGEGKSGKSSILLDAALTLASGEGETLGFKAVEPQRVLYLDAENNERLMARRWPAMIKGKGAERIVSAWDPQDPPMRYVWGHQYSLRSQESLDALTALIESYKPDWLIFDSLIRFGGDLTKAVEMNEMYTRVWKPLCGLVPNGGIILIAHLRKLSETHGRANSASQRLFGSVDIRNFADNHIAVEIHEGTGYRRVECETSRWEQPLFEPIYCNLMESVDRSESRLLRAEAPVEEVKLPQHLALAQAIHDALCLAGADGIAIRDLVNRMIDAGLLDRQKPYDTNRRKTTRAMEHCADPVVHQQEGSLGMRYWTQSQAPRDMFEDKE